MSDHLEQSAERLSDCAVSSSPNTSMILTVFSLCTSCQLTHSVLHHILSGEMPCHHHIYLPWSEKSAMEKILMLLFCDVCHLYRKKDRNLLFIISFCTLIDHVRSYFVKIFVNLYDYYYTLWSIWTCLPAVNLDMFWYQFRCFGEQPLFLWRK